jgi:Zn-dependent protease with chaperone function
MSLSQSLIRFPDISPRSFQHKDDQIANLNALQNLAVPIKAIHSWFDEKYFRIQIVPTCIEVSSRQYPSLWKQYIRMAEALSIYDPPKLYISTSPEVNAFTAGMEKHYIVLYSGLVDLLSEDELLVAIGHELGHIKSEHLLYSSLAQLLLTFGTDFMNTLPIPYIKPVFEIAAVLTLLEWYRKAEFSCDRAALLATQNENAVCSTLAKLAGYSKNLKDEINIEAVKEQAFKYKNIGSESWSDQAIKVFCLLKQTHPYPILRVSELATWAMSSEYHSILDGKYKKIEVRF